MRTASNRLRHIPRLVRTRHALGHPPSRGWQAIHGAKQPSSGMPHPFPTSCAASTIPITSAPLPCSSSATSSSHSTISCGCTPISCATIHRTCDVHRSGRTTRRTSAGGKFCRAPCQRAPLSVGAIVSGRHCQWAPLSAGPIVSLSVAKATIPPAWARRSLPPSHRPRADSYGLVGKR
jgi:hypothetical protein